MALPGAGGIVTAEDLYDGPSLYLPTLTGNTSDPTLGAGSTRTGSYHRMGQLVLGEARIVFGTSGVSAGSGGYRISLPLAPSATHHLASSAVGHASVIGVGQLRDDSAGGATWRTCTLFLGSDAGTGFVYMMTDLSGLVTNAAPWTWAAEDAISVQFSYIAAD